MNILIVEDEMTRRDAFRHNLKEHILTFEDDPLKAIEKLHIYRYDAVFLDCDLGHATNGQLVAKCFYRSENTRTPTLVHSINPLGSLYMQDTLRELEVPVKRCPFNSTPFWGVVRSFLEGITV